MSISELYKYALNTSTNVNVSHTVKCPKNKHASTFTRGVCWHMLAVFGGSACKGIM